MARPPITTAEVGMNRFISPEALWKAVTAMSAGTPTKPASGAMIGMATVAKPDDEGMRNDSGRNSRYITTANAACPTSPSAVSAQCRTVSVISPLFMITVMPRAMPMISATPSRSRAPATNDSVRSTSLRRATSPMITANRMNDAVISGNHHHSVGRERPRSSHGMTPYIISPKARPKIASTALCVPVIVAGSSSAPIRKPASASPRSSWTTEVAGSALIRSAYLSTQKIPRARPTTRITSRETRPSLSGTPAKPEAMPVANGLIVDPSVPMPQPSSSTAAPVRVS